MGLVGWPGVALLFLWLADEVGKWQGLQEGISEGVRTLIGSWANQLKER